MRLLIATPPYAGHLHPNLGIAAAAVAAGHDVVVATTAPCAPEVLATGARHRPVLVGREAEIDAIANPGRRVGWSPRMLLRQLRAHLALLDDADRDLGRAIDEERPDAVLADFTLPIAGLAAQRRGLPWATSHASPSAIETRGGLPGNLGGWRWHEGRAWRMRDAAGRAAVRLAKRGFHRAFRRRARALGLPAVYRSDGSEALYSPELVLALGLEQLEPPATWPRAVRFVGPVRWSPPGEREAPGDVLVTLGTQLPEVKEAAAAAVADAARLLPGLRIRFSWGAGDPVPGDDPPNLERIASADYDRLGEARAVLHHGGAGVTWAALLAGVPQAVHPMDYDQPDIAARLERLGLVVRVPRLDGPSIARGILAAMDAPAGPRARMRELARAADGATASVAAIEELVRQHAGPARG